MDADLQRENRQLVTKLLVIVVVMLGFAFAMVPMYRQICEALGITQGRVVAGANTQVDLSRIVSVELLGSSAGLPWRFEALERTANLHPGELHTAVFQVTNTLGRPVTAHAVMNAAPADAAQYIEKQECFCFTNQSLAAGETRQMPVVFRVSPGVPGEMTTISLSYTFFEVAAGKA